MATILQSYGTVARAFVSNQGEALKALEDGQSVPPLCKFFYIDVSEICYLTSNL
jgi:hypothetical protein